MFGTSSTSVPPSSPETLDNLVAFLKIIADPAMAKGFIEKLQIAHTDAQLREIELAEFASRERVAKAAAELDVRAAAIDAREAELKAKQAELDVREHKISAGESDLAARLAAFEAKRDALLELAKTDPAEDEKWAAIQAERAARGGAASNGGHNGITG